jgi:3-hydroxybutyryl-CoA dehydrogenase
MNRAAVIGAGTMGNGIAHVFAQHGWEVALIDVAEAALERGLATIRGNLDRQVKKGTIAADAPAQILGRIRTATDLAAAQDAALVVEAATERPDLKFGIFETLDAVCGRDTILATNPG